MDGYNEDIFIFVVGIEPVAISNPNIYNSILTITVININGINTIIHDIIPIPFSHNAFNNKVHINMTINFINAVLYKPLNVSIIIWVVEKTTYINAGGHNLNAIYIMMRKKVRHL